MTNIKLDKSSFKCTCLRGGAHFVFAFNQSKAAACRILASLSIQDLSCRMVCTL